MAVDRKASDFTVATTLPPTSYFPFIVPGDTDNYRILKSDLATELGAVTFANPSAVIGLTPVNGSGTDAMQANAAPALSQAIAPTWTGLHTWNRGGTVGILLGNEDSIASKDSLGNAGVILKMTSSDEVAIASNGFANGVNIYGGSAKRLIIPKYKSLVAGVNDLFDLTVVNGNLVAGRVSWGVGCGQGSSFQIIRGDTTYAAIWDGFAWSRSVTTNVTNQVITTGTLSVDFEFVDAGFDVMTFRLTTSTTLTPTQFRATYHIENESNQQISVNYA